MEPPLNAFISGTSYYMAPELYDPSSNDFSKVDTWAAAVVLINMLTGGKYISLDLSKQTEIFSNNLKDELLCDLL
jgi:serine/threonine protein kinase